LALLKLEMIQTIAGERRHHPTPVRDRGQLQPGRHLLPERSLGSGKGKTRRQHGIALGERAKVYPGSQIYPNYFWLITSKMREMIMRSNFMRSKFIFS
jgi:hypothetical protein